MRHEQLSEQGLSHLSFLPPPAQFHPLLHINRIQVKVTTSNEEHLTCAVHSGSLIVTVGVHVTHVDWPGWATLSGPYARPLVLIIEAPVMANAALLPKILLRFPHLWELEIIDRGHNTALLCSILKTYEELCGPQMQPELCPDLREIVWHAPADAFDGIRAMAEHRRRNGTHLLKVRTYIDIDGSRRTAREITLDDSVGTFVEDVLRKGLSGTTIVDMFSEAVTPYLPDGRAGLDVDPLYA
ncbi:hypothetical protein BD626DRAFT_513910 [Schizophyllum amplum]|uniref:Uncharacterized protein n=1 Tax=Schizophyllum amplum TaxID=97359 RepID=A0A550BZ07_9AGAR|nr:hypothetical protein BD626DRAFT_513910 [Auriculariopsis ampla]